MVDFNCDRYVWWGQVRYVVIRAGGAAGPAKCAGQDERQDYVQTMSRVQRGPV